MLPELKIAQWSTFFLLLNYTKYNIQRISFWYRWQVIKLPQQPHCILSRLILYSKANWIMCPFICNSREAKAIYSDGIKATQTLFKYSGCFHMDKDALYIFLRAVRTTPDVSITILCTSWGILKVYKNLMHWKKAGTLGTGAWTGWKTK